MTGIAVLPKKTWNKQDVIALKVLAIRVERLLLINFYRRLAKKTNFFNYPECFLRF